MRDTFQNYMDGFADMTGLPDDVLLPSDRDAINKAVSLLDAALSDAKKIADEQSGAWASFKAKVTGVDIAVIKNEVKTLETAVNSMHGTAQRLLADPNTTHERVISFVKGAADIADLSVLKDNASMNSLTKLVSDVSAATAKDLSVQTKSLAAAIWDGIPLGVKIGGGVVIGLGVIWKIRSL